MQALSLWRYFQSATVPSVVEKAEFWNKQGHIIQQRCVSDERGKSLNLQFHAAPPRLWFLPLGLPDKILNFKHAVNAHPVKAEIEDEALWVRRCFYMVCRPAVEMVIMLHQAYTMTHTESHTDITNPRTLRNACAQTIHRHVNYLFISSAQKQQFHQRQTSAEIGYTFIQTVSDSP